jgi:hypothetical protein
MAWSFPARDAAEIGAAPRGPVRFSSRIQTFDDFGRDDLGHDVSVYLILRMKDIAASRDHAQEANP